MYFATTLRDAKTHSAQAIAALYLRRWDVELFFDDIKTSQRMDMLRCKSPAMAARELLMHMIAYNLVRVLLAQAEGRRPAGQQGRLSFKGTLDRLHHWHGALWGTRAAKTSPDATRKCSKTSPMTWCRHVLDAMSPGWSNDGATATRC